MIEHLLPEGIVNDEPIEQNTEEVSEQEEPDSGEEPIAEESREEGGEQEIHDVVENGEAEVSEEVEGEPQEQEVEPGKHNIKVNGQDYELTTEQLIKGFQKGASSDHKFREAARIQEQAKNLVTSLKNDPLSVLSQLGVDVKALAKSEVSKMVDYEMMSEDQRRSHDYKLELDRVNGENDQRQKIEDRRVQEESVIKEQKEYERQMVEALETDGTVPKNQYTIGRMANYMLRAQEAGVTLPMDRVVAKVKQDYQNDLTAFFGGMDDEKKANFLGKENTRAIAKYQATKVKNGFSSGNKAPVVRRAKSNQVSMNDWKSSLFDEFLKE